MEKILQTRDIPRPPTGKLKNFLFRSCVKLFAVMCCFQTVSAHETYSQDRVLDVSFKNETLANVFAFLTNKTGCQFFYQKNQVTDTYRVSAELTNATLEQVLNKVLKENGYTYDIVGNTIAVSRAKTSVGQQPAYQEGIVVDQNGKAVPGVSVVIPAKQRGTSTDANGRFRINAETGDAIVFSCIGYQSVTINITAQTKLSRVELREATHNVESVSVIAYGEQKTRELTGAIESIKGEDLRNLPSHNIINLLQGRAAGVSVINTSGAPGGGGSTITIRGFNSLSIAEEGRRVSQPLWVIDGIPVPTIDDQFSSDATGTSPVADLDPNFIESIEILKDAAAASMYGSRAANGVILVTTKRGKTGKAQVSINYTESWNFNGKVPMVTGGAEERRFRYLQLRNFAEGYRVTAADKSYYYAIPNSHMETLTGGGRYDILWNSGAGLDVPAVQDSLNSFYNNSTNWFDEFLRVGRVRQANAQISGGTQTSLYHIGVGYYDEKGIQKDTDFSRINLLGNYTSRPFEGLTIDNRIALAYTDRSRNKGRTSYPGLDLFQINPYKLSTLYAGTSSPVWEETLQDIKGRMDKSYDYKLRNNLMLTYYIIPDLKISSSFGVDFWQNMADGFTPSYIDKNNGRSVAGSTVGRSLTLLNENIATYDFKRKNHRFNFVAGQSNQTDQIDRIIGTASGGTSDFIKYAVGYPETHTNVLTNGDTEVVAAQLFQSSHTKRALISWFGRLNYVFKDRYLLGVSFRRDGSSTFGENNKWGNFPSVSAGWIFSDEPFAESMPWLSFGKVRASWGRSGNHFNQPYLALGLYEADATRQFLMNSILTPVWKDGLYNPALTWEETDQYDVGLEFEFLNRKFKVTTDYYYRYTDGLLAPVTLPGAGSYNPYISQWRNAYAISNQGLELTFFAELINTPSTLWELSFNIARNWNRFEGAYDRRDFNSSAHNYNIVGRPLNQLYVYEYNGIFQTNDQVPVYNYVKDRHLYTLAGSDPVYIYRAGDPIYTDVNMDGQITAEDKIFAGSPLPEITGGISTRFSYKNLDVDILFTYLLGRTVLNQSLGSSLKLDITDPTGQDAPVHTTHPILTDLRKYNFWSANNPTGDWPMIQAERGRMIFSNASSNFIQKVNYMRLKSVVVGYNIPKPFKNSGVSFRVFASGENLWLITNYKGRDPESIDIVTGRDSAEAYPLSTRLTAGFSVTF